MAIVLGPAPGAAHATSAVSLQIKLPVSDRIGLVTTATARVEVAATSVPYLADQVPLNGVNVAPGRKLLEMHARVTNLSKRTIDLTNYTQDGVFDGQFDIPRGAYTAAFGNQDEAGGFMPHPSAAYSCHLSDLPIPGDCEIGFKANYLGSLQSLEPGASIPVVLSTDILTSHGTYASVPPTFDVGQVRPFIRDPRDETYANMVPCSNPHHPPTSLEGVLLYPPAKAPTYACEPGLTLELLWPGETVVPVNYNPDLLPTGGDCRISGEDSQSNSALTIASIRAGTTTDVEKSFRSVNSWWVAARSEQFTGVQFQTPGLKIGGLGSDIEVTGGFTFGTEVDMRFDTEAQASKVVRLFKDDYASDPAGKAAATDLATAGVATSYSNSGVDLEGSFGGAPGEISASAARARGVIRYRNGDHGVYSTLDLTGGISKTGTFGLQGDGVRTMELDFSDTDQPVALKTTTDVALSTRLRNFALNGSTEEVLGRIKSAEAAASAQASGGLTLSYQQEVAVPSPPATTDGQIVDTAVRRLVSDLDANPNQLPPDASKVADELGQFESEHIVLSKKGETNVGVKASFSNGLTYGLDFGKTVTTEQAIAAAKREPHGEFQPWTDCVRGP